MAPAPARLPAAKQCDQCSLCEENRKVREALTWANHNIEAMLRRMAELQKALDAELVIKRGIR